ncbi:protein nirf [Anaeramoeba ignava]|uniref:Protein nirf n=1 Tax=Anaeramoeba ignava TaxID=1746090 RepID=A0A9Q0RAP8_ANAIG|nr:protein nirf [Anaeramoeba ignava]
MNFVLLFFISITCFFFLVQSQFNETNSLNFTKGMKTIASSFLDEDEGFLYFLDERDKNGLMYLWKYDMYTLDILNYTDIGITYARYGAIDTVNKLLYVATHYGYQFVKIDLNTMQIIDQIALNDAINNYGVKVEIDLVNQKAYVGYQTPMIVKVDLASFAQESSLTLSNFMLIGSVIDVDNGILYASTDTISGNNATIYKIDLSTFTEVDSLLVNLSGVGKLKCGVIDNTNQMMYFGTYQWPMNIVKINLTDFTSVGSVGTSDGGDCYGAGIDVTNGLGYFLNIYGYLYKLDLATFTIADVLDLNVSMSYTMVIDSSVENSYIGLEYAGVYQVSLPSLTVANRSNSIVYTKPEFILIDEPNQIGYAFFSNSGGILAKVDFESFTLVGYLMMGVYGSDIYQGAIDTTNGFIYLFFDTGNLSIIKIRLSNFSLDGNVAADPDLSGDYITFEQSKQIFYFEYSNKTDHYQYLAKISSPDFQIIASLLLTDMNVYTMDFDFLHGFLYLFYYNYSASGSKKFISKIQASTLSIVGQADLTQYKFEYPVLDQTHQLIYFGHGDEYSYLLICRVNLVNMQVMNDCMNMSLSHFYASFITSSDSWLFLVVDYLNSTSSQYEGVLLQIEASSNQLISNKTINCDLFRSYVYSHDSQTNYGYLLDYYTSETTFYQFSFPPAIPTPPSSSQQILFSFLIFGIMILILGLF